MVLGYKIYTISLNQTAAVTFLIVIIITSYFHYKLSLTMFAIIILKHWNL